MRAHISIASLLVYAIMTLAGPISLVRSLTFVLFVPHVLTNVVNRCPSKSLTPVSLQACCGTDSSHPRSETGMAGIIDSKKKLTWAVAEYQTLCPVDTNCLCRGFARMGDNVRTSGGKEMEPCNHSSSKSRHNKM